MPDEKENKLRALADKFRGMKTQESQEQSAPGRVQELSDATRERYRHILEKQQADLSPHPASGYDRKAEPTAEKTQAGPAKAEPVKETDVQQKAKALAEKLKEAGVGKPKEGKEAPAPQAIQAETRRRAAHER